MIDITQVLKEMKENYAFLFINWIPFLLIFVFSKFYYPMLAFYTMQAPYITPIVGAENIVGGIRLNEWVTQLNSKDFSSLEVELFNTFLIFFFFLVYSVYSKKVSLLSFILPSIFILLVTFLPAFKNIILSIVSLALVCSIPLYSKEKGIAGAIKESFEIFIKNFFEFIFLFCVFVGVLILFSTYINEVVILIDRIAGNLISQTINFLATGLISAFSITLQMIIFRNFAK